MAERTRALSITLKILLFSSLQFQVKGLTCYCHHDPGDTDQRHHCSKNPQSCTTSDDADSCIAFFTKVSCPNGSYTVVSTWECGDHKDFNCNVSLDTHMGYCCRTDFCNENITNPFPPYSSTLPMPSSSSGSGDPPRAPRAPSATIAVVVVVPLVVLLLAVLSIICVSFLLHRRRHTQRRSDNQVEPSEKMLDANEVTFTSGSGSGNPYLRQRTIAREIILQEVIGAGRYGKVYRALWQGDLYAVKIFHTIDEQSWFRETKIYNEVLGPHENILSYLTADMVSNCGSTELWMVVQYHQLGSLYDYLNRDVILKKDEAFKLCLSTINGLLHLHAEIVGAHKKPSIAHRDLKSKNVLVKNNGECCIADFGLAVVQDIQDKTFTVPHGSRQGTKRYMAPEVLSEKIYHSNFESFKQVDIYSFGLVLWEICTKWETLNGTMSYQLPYQGMVQADPSFDEMKQVVVVANMRPQIPNTWHCDDVLQSISRIMAECWCSNPNSRLTALRVKKNLLKARETEKTPPSYLT